MVTARLIVLLAIATLCSSSSQEICPSVCDCHFTYHVTVNCSSRGLSAIPPHIPKNVSHLLLDRNNLTGLRLPSLPSLTVLDASDNVIREGASDLTPTPNLLQLNLHGNRLTHSPNLQHSRITWLDISGNNIEGLNASQYHSSNLRYLNVSHNPLRNVRDQFFEYLPDLEILDTSNTSVPWNSYLSLENLPKLKEVYLRNNMLKKCSDVLSINSSQLEILDLSDNNIIYLKNCTFHQLPNLRELYLDGNNISELSEDSLQSLPALQVLSLDRNIIATIENPVFQSLSSLQKLSISNIPHLFHLGKKAFVGLTELKHLELSNNPLLSYISEELLSEMKNLESLNLSRNNISTLAKPAFPPLSNLLHIDISGNSLACDCHIEWISKILRDNDSVITFTNPNNLTCTLNGSSVLHLIVLDENLSCPQTSLQHVDSRVDFQIGSSARLYCPHQGDQPPKLTWITPRNIQLVYYNTHMLAQRNYPSIADVQYNGSFHKDHYWHATVGYYPELSEHPNRLVILQDGSLYIDYVLRIDSGPYQCIVETPQNKSTSQILLRLDYKVLMEVKIFSLFVGLGCAASFFMLNLIYVFIAAAARKCISQRRREAIMQFLENFDQYKTNKLSSLRENYNNQGARIRETYQNRMTKLRENYNTQMTRLREGASHIKEGTTHRVDIMKDKYQIKQRKLRDYSSQQLHQLRDTYNSQLLKVRDYGSLQLGKIHKKYKLKQKHMIKLLDTLNIDNCRTVIESECIRTESMLFETEDILCTPESRSLCSDEYITASSNNSSNNASQENLQDSGLTDMQYEMDNGNIILHNCLDHDSIDEDSHDGLEMFPARSEENVDQTQVTIQLGADIENEEDETIAQSMV